MSAALFRTIRAGSSDFLRRAAGFSATCAFLTLLAAPAQAAQLTLAWDPSPSTSVSGYYVHVGTAPGTTDRRIDATGLSTTITGLNQGKTYYFSVSAHDTAGTESPRSNEVARSLPLGDFNYNGTADILWRHRTSGRNEIWMMNGATRVAHTYLPAVASGSEIAATADFNGDGTTDILWRGSDGSNTVWLISNGNRTAAAIPAITDSNWRVAGASDFNGDGKADILWRNGSTGEIALWLMNGASRTEVLTIPPVATSLGWAIAAAADFSGDGKADVLWRNGVSGLNSVWIMDSATIVRSRDLPPVVDLNWKIVGTGDFDADGKPDIMWRHATLGENGIWLMNVTTDTTIPTRKVNASPGTVGNLGWRVVRIQDHDGDGKADILWRHDTTGANALWFMNGTASSARVQVRAVTNIEWKVAGN